MYIFLNIKNMGNNCNNCIILQEGENKIVKNGYTYITKNHFSEWDNNLKGKIYFKKFLYEGDFMYGQLRNGTIRMGEKLICSISNVKEIESKADIYGYYTGKIWNIPVVLHYDTHRDQVGHPCVFKPYPVVDFFLYNNEFHIIPDIKNNFDYTHMIQLSEKYTDYDYIHRILKLSSDE